ncbi:hypothetical protein [Actinomadura opuntiae]|uniref:hypothetical protein n=1 Tax=Actinomadura sp. OS1-43 TaxID=604315 RepID=UPI00255AAC02|nr:hypothetical protein [Actinomadura sp. OS1-43]MDL4818661.1 hypothetical protein [Actinomadura sp. OS1-43]
MYSTMLPFVRAKSRLDRNRPAGELPPPGARLAGGAVRGSIVILIIVMVGVLWLLGHGYPSAAALAVIGGAGLIATEIAARLQIASIDNA